MKMTFEKFNETANYYSKTSRTTGNNVWNQDEMQHQFTDLIANCDLTKEQLSSLKSFMVSDNSTIDMTNSKNSSVQEFDDFVKLNEDVIQKSRVA